MAKRLKPAAKAPDSVDIDTEAEKTLRTSIVALRNVIIDLAQIDAFHECHLVASCAEQLQGKLYDLLFPEDHHNHEH